MSAPRQNAQIVRFEAADLETGVEGVPLEEVVANLITCRTDVTTNDEGALVVISKDIAKAFGSLETSSGAFIGNGLHDLNVNGGNYGTQVADDTIWSTRANNTNGALRAIASDPSTPPTSTGSFPAE